jgi:hypothetical protein
MAKKPHPNKKQRAHPGMVLGHLTLVKRVNKPKGYYGDVWLTECVCGTKESVKEQYLFRQPNPKTHCGCLNKGLPSQYPAEYSTWMAMHGRCYRPTHVSYHHYGGRGIRVCDRWLWSNPNGLWNFIQDMGRRPKGLQIDRYPDNDGNYEPSNCRWASPTQQAANKRNSTPPPPPVPDVSHLVHAPGCECYDCWQTLEVNCKK